MTIQGAISQLVALKENSMMPSFFKPYFEKIIETVSDYVETSAEPKWVPVTDRLPIDLQVVNITYINKEPTTYYDHIKGKPRVATAVYYGKRFYWYSVACVDVLGEYGADEWDEMDDRIEVKAWMPLPTPWKGEE